MKNVIFYLPRATIGGDPASSVHASLVNDLCTIFGGVLTGEIVSSVKDPRGRIIQRNYLSHQLRIDDEKGIKVMVDLVVKYAERLGCDGFSYIGLDNRVQPIDVGEYKDARKTTDKS